jgi:hypothetical protein
MQSECTNREREREREREVGEDESEQSGRRLEGENCRDDQRKIEFPPLNPGRQPIFGILSS